MEEVAILSPHGALRAYTVLLTAEPLRGSSLVLSLSATYRPHLPEVRMCVGGLRLSPHGALTCLYGVSYSRASPRLYLGAIFICNSLRVLHCVLTLSYIRLKVSDFL